MSQTTTRVEVNQIQLRIKALETKTTSELQEEWEKVFEESTNSRNKRFLVKRIAYRIQEQVEGGLSELARSRILELARNAPIRRKLLLVAPQLHPASPVRTDAQERPTIGQQQGMALQTPPTRPRDPRLPPVGSRLHKAWKGVGYEVLVLADGFEMNGQRYVGLSGVAHAIAGARWNGFVFFKREIDAAKEGSS